MHEQVDEIKKILTSRILQTFYGKVHDRNKLRFTKGMGCDKKAIRLLFNYNQGMTISLFFKITNTLDIEPSGLIKDLRFKK